MHVPIPIYIIQTRTYLHTVLNFFFLETSSYGHGGGRLSMELTGSHFPCLITVTESALDVSVTHEVIFVPRFFSLYVMGLCWLHFP